VALATDESSTGQVAARAVAQGFRLLAATTLFVDPSIALLEPIGTAGAARTHPVVNGPTNCPAIRSGRVFSVKSAADPVICPFMPFAEGTSGYVCVPLTAGADTLGALFMEPTVGSVVEDTFARAAADRVALSLANRRVLETAAAPGDHRWPHRLAQPALPTGAATGAALAPPGTASRTRRWQWTSTV